MGVWSKVRFTKNNQSWRSVRSIRWTGSKNPVVEGDRVSGRCFHTERVGMGDILHHLKTIYCTT